MGRQCGGCTLCCKLVPVASLNKKAGERCVHQRTGKGCAVYPTRPVDCREWSCMWLTDPATAALGRPDRTRYVIDPVLDTARLVPEGGGPPVDTEVVQVWCDPAFPDAWKDLALFDWLEGVAKRTGAMALIRWDNRAAAMVMAPCVNPDGSGKWGWTHKSEVDPTIGRYSRLPDAERPPL